MAFLFFASSSGSASYDLWKSDGTGTGTVMVKSFASGNTIPELSIVVNGKLFL
ncbi:MAG: hypothetical protein IPP71_19680 [Bacteroidetes bacterium]|nr:hypothetical protein [Bacteroidota bacterium]